MRYGLFCASCVMQQVGEIAVQCCFTMAITLRDTERKSSFSKCDSTLNFPTCSIGQGEIIERSHTETRIVQTFGKCKTAFQVMERFLQIVLTAGKNAQYI